MKKTWIVLHPTIQRMAVKRFACFIFLSVCAWCARADFPSTYEMSGIIDGIIEVCRSSGLYRDGEYEQRVYESFSCGRPVAEVRKNHLEIRESDHPQVRAEYLRGLKEITKDIRSLTLEQKKSLCEQFLDTEC